MGFITPVPTEPHPLDTKAALDLIEINLDYALRQVTYWTNRIAELTEAKIEWLTK